MKPTSKPSPIPIIVLVFPNFLLLDATGPIQVFSSANDEARDMGLSLPYRISLVAKDAGAVLSSSGISVIAESLPKNPSSGTTLIVVGGQVADLPDDTFSLSWLARRSEQLDRCCGVCTGAFVLARAGLLNGRKAVTHWQDVAQLREKYPTVCVLDDAIHVRDGKFYTSAGISAGMDLALSLVTEDMGRDFALGVAKRLVMFLKRSGGQRQFSSSILSHAAENGIRAQLSAWLRPRLQQTINVEQMAIACAVSVRTLHRKLQQEAKLTPAQLLANLRLELACSLLEKTSFSVKQVAYKSGYVSEYNLRRAFVTKLGVLPSEYRQHFT